MSEIKHAEYDAGRAFKPITDRLLDHGGRKASKKEPALHRRQKRIIHVLSELVGNAAKRIVDKHDRQKRKPLHEKIARFLFEEGQRKQEQN